MPRSQDKKGKVSADDSGHYSNEVLDAITRWLDDNTRDDRGLPATCTKDELLLFLRIQRVIDESGQADVNFKKTIGSLWGIEDQRIKAAVAAFFHRVWTHYGERLRQSDTYAWCRNTRLIYGFIAQHIVLDDSWHRLVLACFAIHGYEWSGLLEDISTSTEAARQNAASLRCLIRIDDPDQKKLEE